MVRDNVTHAILFQDSIMFCRPHESYLNGFQGAISIVSQHFAKDQAAAPLAIPSTHPKESVPIQYSQPVITFHPLITTSVISVIPGARYVCQTQMQQVEYAYVQHVSQLLPLTAPPIVSYKVTQPSYMFYILVSGSHHGQFDRIAIHHAQNHTDNIAFSIRKQSNNFTVYRVIVPATHFSHCLDHFSHSERQTLYRQMRRQNIPVYSQKYQIHSFQFYSQQSLVHQVSFIRERGKSNLSSAIALEKLCFMISSQ